jgi:acetyltransferase-like isoleucine patch superfamily enzyme
VIRRILKVVEGVATRCLGAFLLLLVRQVRYVYVAEFASLIPFSLGDAVRYYFYKKTLLECGDNVIISFGTIISERKSRLGSNIYLGTYIIIGTTDIRDYTMISSGCHIPSGSQQHGVDRTDVPMMHQDGKALCVSIGPDVWIGVNSTVLADVGRGCVVGAGSVVVRPVPDWSIAAGNPARTIRRRKASQAPEVQCSGPTVP